MIRMFRFTKVAVLGLSLLAAPMALAETEGQIDAATQEKITTELTAQGYEIRKVTTEDGMIEVYAVKEGKAWELYLDANLKITKACSEGKCEAVAN